MKRKGVLAGMGGWGKQLGLAGLASKRHNLPQHDLFTFLLYSTQGYQYVTDHPTMVIINTASNAPTLTTLKAFPCPNR